MLSYLRHVMHVSVPRSLLHCHRKHFRGLGGRPKTARTRSLGGRHHRRGRSSVRPSARSLSTSSKALTETSWASQRLLLLLLLFYSCSSSLLPPFTIARSSARHHCSTATALPASQPAEATSGAPPGPPRTDRACRLSCSRLRCG